MNDTCISKLSNQEIISYLDNYKYARKHLNIKDDPYADEFNIDIEFDEFMIYLHVGKYNSIPDENNLSLNQYSKINLALYDRGEATKETWDSLKDFTSFKVEDIKIELDIRIFPHKPITVKTDSRFCEQNWATLFNHNTAMLALDEICDVIRYCDKLQNLKPFL